MNIYDDVFGALTGAWKATDTLKSYDIYEEYPGKNQELPLRNVHITVGLDSAHMTGADGLSINDGAIYGTAVIRANICVPKTKSGAQCIRIFEQMSKATRDISSSYEVVKIESDPIRYDSSIGGLVLTARISISCKLYN